MFINNKKYLGQIFLYNTIILKKITNIIKTLSQNKTNIIFEIGAGLGSLTHFLLKKTEQFGEMPEQHGNSSRLPGRCIPAPGNIVDEKSDFCFRMLPAPCAPSF